ncbi:MAG: hypothetical protein MRECE_28c023 [Mycoplasmataceae bacterium CE_OT135]|nr:MAG: hypothetical protein MRECE_28c023 [Mycoplasmataceae bacterium CE_OT135]
MLLAPFPPNLPHFHPFLHLFAEIHSLGRLLPLVAVPKKFVW